MPTGRKIKTRAAFTETSGTQTTLGPKNRSRPFRVTQGLEGRHIALWQSHGRFYQNKTGEWRWQRPRLFGTCEDLYTRSIVAPLPHPDAGERRSRSVHAPRTGRADARSHRRQQYLHARKPLPGSQLQTEVRVARRPYARIRTRANGIHRRTKTLSVTEPHASSLPTRNPKKPLPNGFPASPRKDVMPCT